jgi:hypothetical protein
MNGPISCYGKLPFHREYLRLNLGSPGAAWMVHWIEAAHEALAAAADPAEEGEDDPLLLFAAPAPDPPGVLAGVVRQSSDGLRRHPIVLFVEEAAERADWHLLPLALADLWSGLRALLDRPFASVDELTAALAVRPGGTQPTSAASAYQEALGAVASEGPWRLLTDATGDSARHMAVNLLAVARAQREARAAEEGVAFTVSLATGDDLVRHLRASLWLDLFRAAVGTTIAPTVVLGAAGDPWGRLTAFYRPAEGADLAALLSPRAEAPLDDLGEAWQPWPPADATLAATVERVVAPDPAPPSELLDRLRTA